MGGDDFIVFKYYNQQKTARLRHHCGITGSFIT